MIRVAIVEDEDIYALQIKRYLEKFGIERNESFHITRYMDGKEIVAQYNRDFDIILMDIQMQFMDGMTAAEKIRALDQDVIILFLTNMKQYAVRGYEVDALDYIIKPIEYFSFSQKLMRALARLSKRRKKVISVPIDGGVRRIEIGTIRYVESQGHILMFHIGEEIVKSRGVMRDLEETLCSSGFFRIGKGYLVNMERVDGLKGSDCLVGGEVIPVSRSKKTDFMAALANYLGT